MIIDDSTSANLYHKIMMEDAGMDVEKNVKEFISSEKAKEYFEAMHKNKTLAQLPDVVLLDINIPIINGWEIIQFLEDLDLGSFTPQIYMVSSSRNPRDLKKAVEHPIVKDILEKHLEASFFKQLMETN